MRRRGRAERSRTFQGRLRLKEKKDRPAEEEAILRYERERMMRMGSERERAGVAARMDGRKQRLVLT